MTFRNERFNASLFSLDEFMDGFEDPAKITTFADRGEGVGQMLEQIEPTPDTSPDPDQELAGAVLRLVVAGKDHLVPTLLLIAENRDDREKSLQQMPRRSYFRHRDELLDFFVALQCTYDLRGRDCGEVPQRQSPPQRKQDKKGTEP